MRALGLSILAHFILSLRGKEIVKMVGHKQEVPLVLSFSFVTEIAMTEDFYFISSTIVK